MDILDKAIVFATKAHSGSFRKGTTTPYIVHPMEASAIVATMTDDKIILAAAVLHDVVEDTDYTIDDIVKDTVADCAGFLIQNHQARIVALLKWILGNQFLR